MMRRCLPLFAVLFVLFGFRPIPLTAQEKPTRLTLTAKEINSTLGLEWYGLYFQDKKIGWFKTERTKMGEGKNALFRDSAALHMKLTSMGQKSELAITQFLEFDAAPPYRLPRGEFVQTDGSVNQRIRIESAKDGYVALIVTGKTQQKKVLPAIEHTLEDNLSADVWILRPQGGQFHHRPRF